MKARKRNLKTNRHFSNNNYHRYDRSNADLKESLSTTKYIGRLVMSAILLALLFLGFVFVRDRLDNHVVDANPPMPEGLTQAEVVWVSDGDTIICRITGELPDAVLAIVEAENDSQNEQEYTIRLIGIDAPESVHPNESLNTEEGRLASEYVKSELTGETVYLEFDQQIKDKYDRLLAYVWLDGELFNKKIIEAGHAELLSYPPNTKYLEVFEAAYASRDDECNN